ncbi:hypothetical protein Tco_0495251, partial [Tanacetum coccineum]
ILEIKFGKSPSEFDHLIENPSEINLLEINVEDLINDDDGVEKVYSSEEED